jgi:hypothetical protein
LSPVRVLYSLTGVFAVAGLALRVLPARVPSARSGALTLPTSLPSDSPAPPLVASYGAIVSDNMFSVRREPPAVRFAPMGTSHVVVVAGPHRPSLKLYGITLGPEGAVAVISPDVGVARAGLYEIGDTLAGARVVAISESTVTLQKPNGQITLHLELPSQWN